MGVLKKIGIVVLLYVTMGIVWSVLMHLAILPPPGGLDGPLNLLYLVFQPITLVYFMIVMGLGLFP
ncbi:hypothetical protein EU546_04785 [Candidatus Thorarchaeota archaeon]|nr:MAG: hypothetical protein EU546_04785 [Candidatus Thorarchaeota archaeon]